MRRNVWTRSSATAWARANSATTLADAPAATAAVNSSDAPACVAPRLALHVFHTPRLTDLRRFKTCRSGESPNPPLVPRLTQHSHGHHRYLAIPTVGAAHTDSGTHGPTAAHRRPAAFGATDRHHRSDRIGSHAPNCGGCIRSSGPRISRAVDDRTITAEVATARADGAAA